MTANGQNKETSQGTRANNTNGDGRILSMSDTAGNFSAKPDRIVFLMLKLARDTVKGNANLFLLDKINKPGRMKTASYSASLSRLPYLSVVFYKQNIAIDSMRYGYPLRERMQNTRENSQGYKDIEIGSMEFFIRFQQKETERVKIYLVTYSDKKELLDVSL
jgi:hypothetical protein